MRRAYDARPTVGYDGGGMSRDDREHWEQTHAKAAAPGPAAPFLVEHVHLLRPGRVVDVAAGTGRNAVFLAARGHRVIAVDVARAAVTRVRAMDARIACVQMDLHTPGVRPGSVDGVVVLNFLDRRLFTEVSCWLRPGGILVWDTFLIDQREIGHPRNPSFLLERGELVQRLAGEFRILATREGAVDDGGGRAFRSGIVGERLGPKR